MIIGLGLIIVALIGSHKRGYKGLPKAYGLSEMKDFEHVQPGDKLTSRQIVRIVVDAVPAIIAPVIILGAMFTGIATPTESAVVAVIYSFIVGVGVYREYKIRDVIKVVRRTCKATSTVLWIMCCAGLFGWVLSYSKIPDAIVASLGPFIDGYRDCPDYGLFHVNLSNYPHCCAAIQRFICATGIRSGSLGNCGFSRVLRWYDNPAFWQCSFHNYGGYRYQTA